MREKVVGGVQVGRLESDLRHARQAGDAAEGRVSAAHKDLRAMATLEEEARRLRSQLQAADKRRARDGKALKDSEARAAAAEARAVERGGAVDALQQQLAAVRPPPLCCVFLRWRGFCVGIWRIRYRDSRHCMVQHHMTRPSSATPCPAPRQGVLSNLTRGICEPNGGVRSTLTADGGLGRVQAQAEQRKTTAALDAASKQAKERAAQAEEAQARADAQQAKLQEQAEEIAKLQEERASQRILLPVGMEEELDAPMTRSPRKGAEAVTSGADAVTRGAFRPAAGGGPALLGGSNFTDYSRAFAQGASSGADGGGLRLGGGFSEAASAAAWGPGKAERLLQGLSSHGGAAAAAAAGRVGGASPAVPGINPAAKPFVATKQRAGAATSAGMPTASEASAVSSGMHGMQRTGLSLAPGHDGMHGVALMGTGAPRQGGYGMQPGPGPPLMSLGFFDTGDVSGGAVPRSGANKDALSQGGDLLSGDVLGQGGAGGGIPGSGRGGGAGPPLMQGVSSQMHPLSFMMSPNTQKPQQNIWARPPGASHYG